MSDEKEDFFKGLTKEADIDKKKKEVQHNRINNDYERLEEGRRKDRLANDSSFGALTVERVQELAKESTEYIESAAKPMKFISEIFDRKIPFFAKSLILIGAKTGEGKSTCVANIARNVITQINPSTGKTRRCLVITNEENIVDFYNRVTSLIHGWSYTDHDQFTEIQKKTFEKFIGILSSGGRLTVVDDTHVTSTGEIADGLTTTVEGIETIFKNLIRDQEYYDVVILDYYQGITESTKDPLMDEFRVQSKLTHVLEKYRKLYPAPIVVMAQVNPPEEEKMTPFQTRIQGRKLITTKATVIIEMMAHRENLMTEFYFHKGRFSQATGTSVKAGFKNGQFVKYSDEFIADVNRMREQAEARKLDKNIGMPEVKPALEKKDGKPE